jgi:hypothetical protein
VSAGIAAWIAHVSFWVLLPYGWFFDELAKPGIAVFLLLWAAGWFGLPYVVPQGAAVFSSYVALLDIALVFIIFKGDVKL